MAGVNAASQSVGRMLAGNKKAILPEFTLLAILLCYHFSLQKSGPKSADHPNAKEVSLGGHLVPEFSEHKSAFENYPRS